MIRDINYYQNRAELLRSRDPVANMRLIKKVERKIRKLEKSKNF